MGLCFQGKQLNEAISFSNYVMYILMIVIKAIFLYENIKVLRLKNGVLVIFFHSIMVCV